MISRDSLKYSEPYHPSASVSNPGPSLSESTNSCQIPISDSTLPLTPSMPSGTCNVPTSDDDHVPPCSSQLPSHQLSLTPPPSESQSTSSPVASPSDQPPLQPSTEQFPSNQPTASPDPPLECFTRSATGIRVTPFLQ